MFDIERMASDQCMYPHVALPASSVLPSSVVTDIPGEPHSLGTRPKQKVSPRGVHEDLWTSAARSDQPKGRIPGHLIVLGLDSKPEYQTEYNKSKYRSNSSSGGWSSSSKSKVGLVPSESTSAQREPLFRPQHIQIESRQLSGSSTDAQLMESNNLPPIASTEKNTNHPALTPLQKDHGLTYALRRTDSNSTFQSLDGLNSAYPLIRKEAKKRKQKQQQRIRSRNKGTEGTKGSSKSVPPKTNPLSGYALQCFVSPCLGVDDRVASIRQERSRRPRSELVTRGKLLELKSELSEMRQKACRSYNMSTSEASRVSLERNVRFANPVVTLVNYRPYTEACDIPFLYFQEEELEELEWDREMDSGDQFECFIDSRGLAISVDYRLAAHE